MSLGNVQGDDVRDCSVQFTQNEAGDIVSLYGKQALGG